MKQFLPALAAVSGACSLVAAPAAALELGALKVESKLGQPLRASIAYALQPNEQLHAYCIFLQPGIAGSGLPSVSRARIDVRDNAILLTGSTPIRELMLGLRVSIDCPYTANLLREYTMFIDPSTPAPIESATQPNSKISLATVPEARQAETVPRRTVAAASSRPGSVDRSPLPGNSRYRVQPGDSLSGIIARISDRPPGLWPAVDAVFAANPHAFIDGDVNLIKAGSWLEIPDLYLALGTATADVAAEPVDNSAAQSVSSSATYDGFESQPAINETIEPGTSVEVTSSGGAPATSSVEMPDSSPEVLGDESAATTLRPGDVIIDSDSPFVSDAERVPQQEAGNTATVMIPDTSVRGAVTGPLMGKSESAGAATRSWSWLAWLGGAGLAVFLALLFFGRNFRGRFGSTPVGAVDALAQHRRREDPDRRSSVPAADIDYDLDAIPENASAMSLDADLGLGTGFRDDSDIDVAQDFGFSASDDFATDFDLDLTSAASDEPEQQPTDIIPPQHSIETSILESEIPPSDDDEYDLSMIVDATRQPVVDTHLTAKDLKAIAIGSADDEDDGEEYTLSREVDYKILEQDYQEEFTTTQALNEEMARAARELAETMARKDAADDTAEMTADLERADEAGMTAELPPTADNGDAEISAELTANLAGHGKAVNDDLISNLDDTGINEELTTELPNADNDVTVEMDVEGGRIDTKKSRAS